MGFEPTSGKAQRICNPSLPSISNDSDGTCNDNPSTATNTATNAAQSDPDLTALAEALAVLPEADRPATVARRSGSGTDDADGAGAIRVYSAGGMGAEAAPGYVYLTPRTFLENIRAGKNAVKWTKLSCHDFVDNQVRLQLFALAYNWHTASRRGDLGNFLRRLVLPRPMKSWTMTTLREKLIKIGAKVVRHARYVTLQMAQVAVPRRLYRAILERIRRIAALSPRAAPI